MIKLNHYFRFAVAGFMSSASRLNEGYIKPDKRDLSGLKTLTEFVSEEKEIKKLINKYIGLVEKDATDIYAMVDFYIDTDSKLSVQPNMCPVKRPSSSKRSKNASGASNKYNGGGGESW